MAQRQPTRRGVNWISLFFAALAVVFLVAAIWMARPLWSGQDIPRPEAESGQLEFVHVADALAAQGLAVEQNQGFIPIGELSVPGQGVTVDGAPLFIFIYQNAATPAAELAAAQPSAIRPRDTSITSEPELLQSSNVVVALFEATDDVRAKVEQAMAELP